jgi:hypothetical protein
VGGDCASEDDVAAWGEAGVDRVIVSPWRRTAEVLDAMAAFSARFIPGGEAGAEGSEPGSGFPSSGAL